MLRNDISTEENKLNQGSIRPIGNQENQTEFQVNQENETESQGSQEIEAESQDSQETEIQSQASKDLEDSTDNTNNNSEVSNNNNNNNNNNELSVRYNVTRVNFSNDPSSNVSNDSNDSEGPPRTESKINVEANSFNVICDVVNSHSLLKKEESSNTKKKSAKKLYYKADVNLNKPNIIRSDRGYNAAKETNELYQYMQRNEIESSHNYSNLNHNETIATKISAGVSSLFYNANQVKNSIKNSAKDTIKKQLKKL